MKTQRQFQHPIRQHKIQDEITQILTVIEPNITLPVRQKLLLPLPPPRLYPTEQQTPMMMDLPENAEVSIPTQTSISHKKKLLRTIALISMLFLGLMIYFTWRSMNASAAPPAVLQQNYGSASITPTTSTVGSTADSNTGEIVVYILGSITRPGIYNLPTDARVYQLVQAAGGLLPNANAVALNMAAKLTDGEEIYVLAVGEVVPSSISTPVGSNNGTPDTLAPGQRVNINTASEDDLRQNLHVSAATAQAIIAYRTQHGPYTSIEQLLNVISQAIYTRIKDMITV
jgi:competence protein ComEA